MNRGSRIVLALVALIVLSGPAWGQKNIQSTSPLIERTLTRLEFSQVMAKGPQRFIATMHLDPHSVKGRFVGWRIGGFAPNSGFVNSQSILVGDIIVSVNGEPLERPEQFMRAWEVVRNASTVTVKLIRGKTRMVYRWTIQP